MGKMQLPIYQVSDKIVDAVSLHRRVVIQAPTGSGKSTQVPQMLLDSGIFDGQITVLQPRRIAARMLARRVAMERGEKLGGEVGYQVRFENHVGSKTRIRYVTEGILLRELTSTPDIPSIGIVIFDEFHERHLFGDVTLAMLRVLQETTRPDIRIVVMSATLDGDALKRYLNPCECVESEGRTYPVDVQYLDRAIDFRKTPVWETAADCTQSALKNKADGDVLIFMPGAYEIRRTIAALQTRAGLKGCDIVPLHGELPAGQQDQAVQKGSKRKVVVATNVAETSITIEGVSMVIDSGLVRTAKYDARRGMDSLLVEKISRASADQRTGRAGRTRDGVCYRLWTQHDHQGRSAHQKAEILRHDLTEILLTLKAGGIEELDDFPWFEAPDPHAVDYALTFLQDVGALDAEGNIRAAGHRMLAFPVHPRYACMLMEAEKYNCVYEVAWIAALLQGRGVLLNRVDKAQREKRDALLGEEDASDLFRSFRAAQFALDHCFEIRDCEPLGIHAGAARTANAVFKQFIKAAERIGLKVNREEADMEKVQKCLLAGFIDRLARRIDKGSLRCKLVHNRAGELSRSSAIHDSPLFVAADMAEIEGGRREINILLSQVTAVKEEWLQALSSEAFVDVNECFWDSRTKRIRRTRKRCFHDLVLEEKIDDQVDPEQAGVILAAQILAGNITLNKWNKDVDQWIERVNTLSRACPQWEIPLVDDDALKAILEQFCYGANSARALKDRSVLHAIKDWLSPAQRDLVEKQVPARMLLPSGRKARIRYEKNILPTISATIQNLYDLKKSPSIAGGSLRLRFEILAPNQRPIQITEDLASFWENQYPAIKQELQRKYYKHEWR